jgi:hypothetical protein
MRRLKWGAIKKMLKQVQDSLRSVQDDRECILRN